MGKDGKGTRRLLADYRVQRKAVQGQEALVEMIRQELGSLHTASGEIPSSGTSRPSERQIMRLSEEEHMLQRMKVMLEWRKGMVTAYINSVNDPMTRLLLHQRYINGMSWKKLSARYGSGASESAMRMMVVRYTNRHPISWIQ